MSCEWRRADGFYCSKKVAKIVVQGCLGMHVQHMFLCDPHFGSWEPLYHHCIICRGFIAQILIRDLITGNTLWRE